MFCLLILYSSQWLKRASFKLVSPATVCFQVWITGCQARECCEKVCVVWGGWMFVCRRGNKACSRCWCIEVLSCSDEAYGGETASPDISKVKREVSKLRKLLSEPLHWKKGRFTCNWGHFWHDIKWSGLLSTLLNTWASITHKGVKKSTGGRFGFEDYEAFGTQQQDHETLYCFSSFIK